MTDQMNSKPIPPAGGTNNEGEIKFCKICGEELTETNHSKEKKDVCLDCEGKGNDATEDHTQKNANQDGVDSASAL
ncbi:MAG: hypothetical protein NT039_01765 [Candidatus Berkelbacteria bacterium]|nr:hypothetical protein [Candidatus Berkelbacteria bacterium]